MLPCKVDKNSFDITTPASCWFWFLDGCRLFFAETVKLDTERLNRDYTSVSDVFIAQEKQTIEQYIIAFRINKVKELLVYSDATLSDISFNLHFSSVAHLSAQFKQYTGLTPSYFREIKKKKAEASLSGNEP